MKNKINFNRVNLLYSNKKIKCVSKEEFKVMISHKKITPVKVQLGPSWVSTLFVDLKEEYYE